MFERWESRKSCSRGLGYLLGLLYLPNFTLGSMNLFDSRDTYPAPVVVPPTGQWDGNDGSWSTFGLQIGTPPQTVKVLISTAGSETMLIAPEGCVAGDLINCKKLRGEFYTYNDSSTYSPLLINVTNSIYTLTLESELGYGGKGRYGFDDISFSWQGKEGIKVKNQTVAGIATKDFFIGLLGLGPSASNFGSYNNPIPSLMKNMRTMSLIPSISWGYTAGNQYRLNKIPGSLVLGGYDQSKFTPNNITFPFRDSLDVMIQGIKTNQGAQEIPLLDSPIQSTIDSTIPYIYLPISTCKLFENAFGLTWNESSKLYFLNDSQHESLLARNPNFVFTLSPEDPTTGVEISLPYSAFDLTASAPLADPPTRYFPLKRADNSTQHRIGRTFLQEAYIIADYERKTFSVSQCKWDARQASQIVPILPKSNGTPDTVPEENAKKKFPIAAIGGIAGGAALLSLVGALLLYLCYLKPRRKKQEADAASGLAHATVNNPEIIKPELDGNSTGIPDPRTEAFEVDGRKLYAVLEGDSHPVFELPAEEVASEMLGSGGTPELDGRGQKKGSIRMFRRGRRESVRREDLVSPQTPRFGGSYPSSTVSPGTPATEATPFMDGSRNLSPFGSPTRELSFTPPPQDMGLHRGRST